MFVAAQPSLHACCHRPAADHDEQRIGIGLDLLAMCFVADHDGVELLVAARLGHLGAGADLDPVVRLDAVDQVARHALLERVGTADDGDTSGDVRELQRRLAGRVCAADDDDVAVAAERCLRGRGAVVHAGADELVDAGRFEPPVVDAVRGDAGARADGGAAGQLELERSALARHRADELGADEDLRTEPGGLCVDAGGKLGAADPVGKAGVVLDPGARPRLAARSQRLDDQRPQPLRSGIERGREARPGRRPGSRRRRARAAAASGGPRAWRARA